MPRRHNKALLILGCGFLWTCAAGAQAPDPLAADPQHTHLELENKWVRVFQEHMGPHETMPMHKHPAPGAVVIFLTDRDNRLTYLDGTVKTLQNHAGEVLWALPTIHKGENLRDAQFAALQVEPKPVANPKPFPTESTDAVI